MQTGRHIVVTSANCATARLLIPRLREKGYYVTGLIRQPAKIGADETITDWMNMPAAARALAEAAVIVHLSGDANAKNKAAYFAANYGTTKRVVDAAGDAKHQRIIYLSYAGAGSYRKNYYLFYKSEAEQLLLATGKEVLIFRCPVIIDTPGTASRMDDLFIAKKGKAVPVLGDGRQKIRPLVRGDVVNMILAAIERGETGIYDLPGPEEMTIDDFIRLVNRDPDVPMRHIPGWAAAILSWFIPGLSPTFVDLMLHHTDSAGEVGAPDSFREFGVSPTSVISLYGGKG